MIHLGLIFVDLHGLYNPFRSLYSRKWFQADFQCFQEHRERWGPCVPTFEQKKMCREDFLVASICLLCFAVERPKETLIVLHDMGGPLSQNRVEGWWSKEFLLMLGDVVRTASAKTGGRTILGRRQEEREFDSTKGYPVEDGD